MGTFRPYREVAGSSWRRNRPQPTTIRFPQPAGPSPARSEAGRGNSAEVAWISLRGEAGVIATRAVGVARAAALVSGVDKIGKGKCNRHQGDWRREFTTTAKRSRFRQQRRKDQWAGLPATTTSPSTNGTSRAIAPAPTPPISIASWQDTWGRTVSVCTCPDLFHLIPVFSTCWTVVVALCWFAAVSLCGGRSRLRLCYEHRWRPPDLLTIVDWLLGLSEYGKHQFSTSDSQGVANKQDLSRDHGTGLRHLKFRWAGTGRDKVIQKTDGMTA